MRFLHAADIHLGNQQYNNRERYNDFYRVLQRVTQTAIDQQVGVCIIAGDLFHKSAVDPLTLMQAEKCLRTMRNEGIQVLAVAGNHDRQRYQDDRSWLHYLAWNEYLTLLEPSLAGQDMTCLVEGKSYVDIDSVRFIGIPYYGATTNAILERVVGEMPQLDWNNTRYTVLITHAGIEGEIPDVPGCLLMSDLLPLRQYVDFIATGHLHKPFVKDKWIYNPGAIENCDFNEEIYRKDGKGVFRVDVATDGTAVIEKLSIHGRPFHTVIFSVDSYSAVTELNAALREHLQTECRKWASSDDIPVVRVVVRGNLAFDRTLIDVEGLRQTLQSDIDCLLLRLEMHVNGFDMDIDASDAPTFEVLERQVFEEMARRDIRFSSEAESWGQLMREVKDMATLKVAPEEIYERLQVQLRRGG